MDEPGFGDAQHRGYAETRAACGSVWGWGPRPYRFKPARRVGILVRERIERRDEAQRHKDREGRHYRFRSRCPVRSGKRCVHLVAGRQMWSRYLEREKRL